ncbi:MAG TPA: YgiQ family radical SAM protein [Planctomycetota bacterium]|nr:YgiQ family radical SAM protein [Planctomycetota bacterium]
MNHDKTSVSRELVPLAPFLPRTREQMAERGWGELDIVLVTGDAYVDHPSFGVAAIGRLLEAKGYRVGIFDVPELDDVGEPGSGWRRLPAPRLFVGISAGTIDSMVTNYTASKKLRHVDVYRPGGKSGRPNRATIAYTAQARHVFPGVPIVVGGLEAGPRRLAHYDFWEDKLRRSILVDSKADLLVWGMGERTVLELARRIAAGESLTGIASTCIVVAKANVPANARHVPSFETLREKVDLQIDLFQAVREENAPDSKPLAQAHGERFVVQFPPQAPASQEEVDEYYDLPFRREWHPDHDAAGGVPALEPVRWSVNTHRGCLADCTFCSITFHQGRAIQSRSPESILREAKTLAAHHDFRGTITDVGGPTANMYGLGCKLLEAGKGCLGRDCLSPDVCPALRIDSESEGYRRLLALVKQTKGVKHAFVSSGIRYDMLRSTKSATRGELLPLHKDLVANHTPGRMKLAPEHASPNVLRAMNKPSFDVYEAYEKDYKEACADLGKDQHLVNYFIVGHPGTTMKDAVVLFEKLLERNYSPEQAQEFIPLPMTRACVQYVTGKDPITYEELYVPRGGRERRLQKALVRWRVPENQKLVEEALREAGREDLLPKFRHALRQRNAKAAKAGRGEAQVDLDTCG